jgi:predicted dehydrogenase
MKSANSPLPLGFIGGSLDSAVGYTHFVSCLMDKKWSLEAGCFSNNHEINHETAQTYGVPAGRVYDNWQDMLQAEKGKLAAILILTPTPTHFDKVMACLDAGYAVICEKALVAHTAEARQILEKRDRTNGFLAMIYNYSGYPMVRELRQKIHRGELGRILHFQVEMPQEGFIRVDPAGNKPSPQPWRLSDGPIPTIHLDLAVHLHQLVYYLLGKKPLAVTSQQNCYGWFPSIVDQVTSLCSYSDGVQGQYWFSKSALGHRNGLKLRIYGSKASAEWYQANPEELLLAYADGRREILDRASAVTVANARRYNRFKAGHPAGFIEAFANLYVDISQCLRQFQSTGTWQSAEVFSVELALEGLIFLESMAIAAEKKDWQPVGEQIYQQ